MRGSTVNADLQQWNAEMRKRLEPLGTQCAFSVRHGNQSVGFQQDVPFEVGSTFKAFVAAEYARQVGQGVADPDMRLTIQPEDRVESSHRLEAIPDGETVSLQDAAEAMIGVSDNTATDMVLRVLGAERVRALLSELGVHPTSIPDSVKSIYDRFKADRTWRPEACITTMRDLTVFYTAIMSDRAWESGAAKERFLHLMRQEDIVQGAEWGESVTCYRKSGSLQPPPLLAMGIAGAFVSSNGGVTAFAFALNVESPEDAAFEDSPLDPIVRTFSEGLWFGMEALAKA